MARVAVAVLVFAGVSIADAQRVTIAASDVDRAGQVITFSLPAEAPETPVLRAADGQLIPLQRGANRSASFVVTEQKAGATLHYAIENAPVSRTSGVTVTRAPEHLRVALNDAAVLEYRTDKEALPRAGIEAKFKRAGYLHPVLTPAGAVVTDDYPANHIHHHGVWAAWSKTKFRDRAPNFWEMGEQTGTVEFVAVERTWNGAVHGGFVARQRFVDLSAATPAAVLDEKWEVTVYALEATKTAARMFDLASTQACATAEPLQLPKLHYGGFGFRGHGDWDGRERLTVLTSEGEIERNQANGTRVRWCYVGSKDRPGAGVAILGHPENFRAPQPIRVHPDMPFLCFAPSHLGDWAIEPGKPCAARYRILAIDGPPERARLEAFWNGYARAAEVTVSGR